MNRVLYELALVRQGELVRQGDSQRLAARATAAAKRPQLATAARRSGGLRRLRLAHRG